MGDEPEHVKMECDSSLPELDAELADANKVKGNKAYQAGDYEEARDQYTQAIYHNPNCATYWSNRSAVLMMLEDFAGALDDSTQSIKLDESYVKGYLRAAKCHLMLGNPSLSIDYYNKVLMMECKNKQAKAELQVSKNVLRDLEGSVFAMKNKQYHRAVVMLQHCLEEAPQCVLFRTMLAEALVFSKSYSEAHTIANDLLRRDRNNANALYVKAMCYYYQDDEDKAIQFFQHSLRSDPDHSKSRLALKQAKLLRRKKEEGNTLFHEGKHQEAHAVYSQALEVDPLNSLTNAKLYCNRALVGSKIGRMDEAIQDCCEAISFDPDYLRPYKRRAKLYQEKGQHDEAVRDLELLLQREQTAENKAAVREAKHLQKLAKRKDYYKILGVNKSVSEDEIKKAYKRCALLHHPDRHANAEDSVREEEERIFKEVSEAYTILSDTRKRARYDSGQDLEEMEFNPTDVFSSMFGGFGGGGPHFSFGGPGGVHFQFS